MHLSMDVIHSVETASCSCLEHSSPYAQSGTSSLWPGVVRCWAGRGRGRRLRLWFRAAAHHHHQHQQRRPGIFGARHREGRGRGAGSGRPGRRPAVSHQSVPGCALRWWWSPLLGVCGSNAGQWGSGATPTCHRYQHRRRTQTRVADATAVAVQVHIQFSRLRRVFGKLLCRYGLFFYWSKPIF